MQVGESPPAQYSGSVDNVRYQQFEQIGLQQRLFSRQQLGQARQIAAQRGRDPGEVLIQQGVLTREQLKGLERAITYRLGRDQDKEIAKIIIDSNYCDPARVEAALRKQKEFYGKTGELMRLGVLLVEGRDITESQRVAAYKIHDIERRASSGSHPRLPR